MPMEPLRELGKVLLLLGALLVGVGLFFVLGARLPLRIGRLPGDIYYHGKHGSFYFPIVTCILLSAALTLLFWIAGHFRR
jgi:hypothetical protein